MDFIIICSILFVIATAILIYEQRDNIITWWYDFKDIMEADTKKRKRKKKRRKNKK